MNLKNSEGYMDTTAEIAIQHVDRKAHQDERIRQEMLDQRDEFVNDAIKIFKRMIRLGNFELIKRVELRDKLTGKEYR